MLFTTVMLLPTQSLEPRHSFHTDNYHNNRYHTSLLYLAQYSVLHIFIHLIITATLICSYHFQMMQVRHKEVRWHAQGHTAGMWLGCDLNP